MEPAQAGGGLLSRVFLLDGCTRRLPHTAELLKAYPAGRNQQLVIRILVAHHLGSGLAVRPCWGPLYGGEAVSEQRLTEQILERLPAEPVLMADRNFAVFSVAWAAPQHHHGVLFRITEERASGIAGQILPPAGCERRIEWHPSPHERRTHPELPSEAVMRCPLIVAPPPRHLSRCGPVGGRIQASAALGVARQTAEQDPPPIISQSSLGQRRHLS